MHSLLECHAALVHARKRPRAANLPISVFRTQRILQSVHMHAGGRRGHNGREGAQESMACAKLQGRMRSHRNKKPDPFDVDLPGSSEIDQDRQTDKFDERIRIVCSDHKEVRKHRMELIHKVHPPAGGL